MNKQLKKSLLFAQQASHTMALLSAPKKKQLLQCIARTLTKNKKSIFAANALDVALTSAKGANASFIDRLTLSRRGFAAMISQLMTVALLDDPLHECIEQRTLPNGIKLQKIRFPLGVIAMIYESRPNVTIDVAGLCIKSGNAVILKGGSEALHTNRILVQCIHEVLRQFALPEAAVTFLDSATHQMVRDMLTRNDLIDVVIPRGSYALTTSVAKNSRIPILYHASGGARMYVDHSADLLSALNICVNAKTQRTGVCNALDMVLVHTKIAKAFLTQLDTLLVATGCSIRADTKAQASMPHAIKATKTDFVTEFLDTILAVKVVSNAQEAISFMQARTHGHTEILAAANKHVIQTFIQDINAAGLMINCSSRLHDGSEFGMGAEMGTATGKLHARGPVGVKELTTYKWIAYGNGQIKK